MSCIILFNFKFQVLHKNKNKLPIYCQAQLKKLTKTKIQNPYPSQGLSYDPRR